jgi:hypothetical protein
MRRPRNAARDELTRHACLGRMLERFRAKWIPVRVKKTRQIKIIEPASDSIRSEKALKCEARLRTDAPAIHHFRNDLQEDGWPGQARP